MEHRNDLHASPLEGVHAPLRFRIRDVEMECRGPMESSETIKLQGGQAWHVQMSQWHSFTSRAAQKARPFPALVLTKKPLSRNQVAAPFKAGHHHRRDEQIWCTNPDYFQR